MVLFVYQPSHGDLGEAVAIMVGCGRVRGRIRFFPEPRLPACEVIVLHGERIPTIVGKRLRKRA